jgi:hypothetical protein
MPATSRGPAVSNLGFEHWLQVRCRELALGVDLGFERLSVLCALALRLFDLVSARGDRASCRDRGGGERELEPSFDLFGDPV